MLTISKELEKKVIDLIGEGKSDETIIKELSKDEECKKFDVKEIVDMLSENKKQAEVMAEIKKREKLEIKTAQEKFEKDENLKQVNTIVAEKLKSIGINEFGDFRNSKELKVFDFTTGKLKKVIRPSEIYGQFNNMLKQMCLARSGDASADANAKAIEKEIAQDNAIYMDQIMGNKATPAVSDVDNRGGFSIPTEVEMIIKQLEYQESTMLPIVNQDSAIVFEDKIYPVVYNYSMNYIANQSTDITEKNLTFTNPTINMERIGAWTAISNAFLRQKGVDISNAVINAIASETAKFVDLHIPCGNVTNAGDLIDGICFDANSEFPTAIALASVVVNSLADIKNTLDPSVSLKNVYFVVNRKVADEIGLLQNGAGNYTFNGYVEGREIRPLGIKLVINPQIPSVLEINGDDRTGGTDDVIICADFTKVIVGMTPTKIDFSNHFLFTSDATAIRAVKSYGQKVIMGSGDAGIVSVVQELTNV